MKKLILILVSILLVSAVTACSQTIIPAPSTTATPNQTIPTVTVTSTKTSTATATSTVTATVTATPSNPSSTSTPAVSPNKTADFESFNNPSFFVNRFASTPTTTVNKDGTISQVPTFTDVFVDLDLGGFFTNREALFIPKIPGITTRDDWVYRFNFPAYSLPFTINMGYKLKTDNPEIKLEFYLFGKDYFNSNYEKSPLAIYGGSLVKPGLVSSQNVYTYKINDSGDFVAVFRTANASDIAGWWVKYGGKHY
jgi:hypothetical protein